MPCPSRTSKNAFTLVELLVVITILVLLVALLLPALGKARRKAKNVICASNAHQSLTGCINYASDHKNALPQPIFLTSSQPYAGYVAWRAGVFAGLGLAWTDGYIGDAHVFYCPLQTAPAFMFESYTDANGKWADPLTLTGVYVRTAYQFNNIRMEYGQASNTYTPRLKFTDYENQPMVTDLIHKEVSTGMVQAHDEEYAVTAGFPDGSASLHTSVAATKLWDSYGTVGGNWPQYENILDRFWHESP